MKMEAREILPRFSSPKKRPGAGREITYFSAGTTSDRAKQPGKPGKPHPAVPKSPSDCRVNVTFPPSVRRNFSE
jgi:hypothetical protein